MKAINIQKLEDIKILKNSYETYKLDDACNFKQVSLEHDEDNGYCWSLTFNYKITKMTGYIFPLINQGGMEVKFFKTESGCKRNLKKPTEWKLKIC